MNKVYLLPPSASNWVNQIDALYWALVALSLLLAAGIFIAIVFLAFKYRRTPERQNGLMVIESKLLEITWSIIPMFIGFGIFAWGSIIYMKTRIPPADSLEISVVGKQWMWKIQHPEGRREINELHMPVGRPIVLRMISQDVLHSFYVPAFRIKQDVLPGRYTTMWFESDKVGTYHLFCAEYCGKDHSVMIGKVHVMTQEAYDTWLMQDRSLPVNKGAGLALAAVPVPTLPASGDSVASGEKPEETGKRLFTSLACATCHTESDTSPGPSLHGLFGKTVELTDGSKVKFDENYVRESILTPSAKIVKGRNNLMPPFAGRISEEDILSLIAYIKTLRRAP